MLEGTTKGGGGIAVVHKIPQAPQQDPVAHIHIVKKSLFPTHIWHGVDKPPQRHVPRLVTKENMQRLGIPP